MTGTLLNVVAIVLGATLGVALGGRLPARVRGTVTDVLGLFVVVLGIDGALATFGPELRGSLGRAAVLVILGSLLLGGVLGEVVDLDGRLARLGSWLRARTVGRRDAPDADPSGTSLDASGPDPVTDPRHRFVEGFVVASLVVCVGPLAILGPLQDGLTGDYQLLAVKSLLDGFAALAFASALGIGVAFAVLPLFVLQASVALTARTLGDVVTDPMLAAITATGGFLVIGIGLRLLEIRQVRVANLLPGLVLAPVAVAVWP
ncbi:MAG: DUF554 domain-containing protein [Actinobacteria bacterium]|nr:DUF554 domain-containing protein [Actinomycetota bacterium]